MKNILITSAGRRVSLVRAFQDEVKLLSLDAKVLTVDAHPDYAAACRISDGFYTIVPATSTTYISDLLALALAHQVRFIVPTIDTELLILSQNRALFESHGIVVIVSDAALITIFRDKRLTHDFFRHYGIHCAQEYTKEDFTLPMYLKPYDGSRSQDNYLIRHAEQLTDYHFENEKMLFLEYLDHQTHTEFTIDLYYDKHSNLKCLVPRERVEVRDGEVNKAITRASFFNEVLWQKLHYVAGFRGCITLQVFVNFATERIIGIEINPRFGGGFPLSYLADANFPKWLLQEYLLDFKDIPVFHDWKKNLLMLRYDHEVLVPNFENHE